MVEGISLTEWLLKNIPENILSDGEKSQLVRQKTSVSVVLVGFVYIL